jgi:putative alpha-1,2-mannosidase
VGVSSIGPDEARDHAAAGIDDMLCRAHDAWVTAFSRLEVEGAPPALRRAIAGSLARVFAYPNRHDEDGRYRSPVDGGVRDGAFSSNNGFWDTYRTAWPLLGLLAPRTAARLADGFVQHFRDAGWVARWSAPGPVDSMTGTTSDTVFAGLAEQGVAIDLDAAYASADTSISVRTRAWDGRSTGPSTTAPRRGWRNSSSERVATPRSCMLNTSISRAAP